MVAARAKALLIHHTGDPDAAGDEVEQAVRTVLRRKLPSAYYVGHGRVVDARWASSSQLDVVIADNLGASVLFRTAAGTEYFPYESVYAVGEVKLPNLLCFLNRGVVANMRLAEDPAVAGQGPRSINIHAEFNQEEPGRVNRWVFFPFGTDDRALAGNFGFLYFALVTHLQSCVLMPPDMLAYLQAVFTPSGKMEATVFA